VQSLLVSSSRKEFVQGFCTSTSWPMCEPSILLKNSRRSRRLRFNVTFAFSTALLHLGSGDALVAYSATHVFVEPVNRALPGQIGRDFVIPFRRRVAIEPMYSARVNIAVVRYVRRVQGLVVSRPGRC
jgi:hypothetical protein